MFRKRLFASLITIFALGVVFAVILRNYDTASLRALFIVIASVSVLAFAISRFNSGIVMSKNISAAALAVAAFSLGVLRVSLYNVDAVQEKSLNGYEDRITVKVIEVNENYVDAYIIESEIGVDSYTKIRLYLNEVGESIRIGDYLTSDAKYKYSNKLNLLSDGIALTSSVDKSELSEGSGLLYTVRSTVSENAEELFGRFYSATEISKAVTTGDRSGLDSYIFAVYKSGGVSHLLAISGLHITLIAMSFKRFLVSIKAGNRVASVISLITTVFYTALVGFTPSAMRSAIMMFFVLINDMRIRHSDNITSLFVALFLLLCINPYSVCGAGLQLSFLCSFGIMLATPLLNKFDYYIYQKTDLPKAKRSLFYRALYAFISPMAISFTASIFSFPVLCMSFDTVSYVSPLVNVFIVPLFSYAIGIALVANMVAPISTLVASIIAFPAGAIFEGSTWINAFLYENDIGFVSVHSPIMYVPLAISCIMIGFMVFKRKRRMGYTLCLAVVFSVALSVCCFVTENTVSKRLYIQYGDDGSEYVYYQSNVKNVYVDLSGYSSNPDVVFEKGRTSLDDYVLLDYDSYSYGRLNYISGNLNITTIYLQKPENIYENNIYSQIKELANQRNCDIIEYDMSYISGTEENECIYIIKNTFAPDEYSIVVTHDETSIHFVSDGYSHPINTDFLVLTGSYSNSNYMVSCDKKYAKFEIIEESSVSYLGFLPYERNIEFVAKINESDFVIYES